MPIQRKKLNYDTSNNPNIPRSKYVPYPGGTNTTKSMSLFGASGSVAHRSVVRHGEAGWADEVRMLAENGILLFEFQVGTQAPKNIQHKL